jgi:PAS domain S-box-containing protein
MRSPIVDDRLTSRKAWILSCGAFLFVVLLLLPTTPSVASNTQRTIKIGVLAYRGVDEAMKMWSPTAAYLTDRVPGCSFTIVPLSFQEIGPAVERGDVEFVLANPSIYAELESRYGASSVATLKNRGNGGGYTVFGGVIICRADRTGINSLSDLKGRSFMAVDETSLGGWQVAWREIRDSGIDPYRDFPDLQFGKVHDAVVLAVRDGKVDAGAVRTDTLERMASEGKINVRDFRVLNQQQREGFPFALSTRLYPEWPFARVKHTDDELAKRVVIALLGMRMESRAARAAQITGWTIPLDYRPVHELLKDLRLGPYANEGDITLAAVVRQYRYWVFLWMLVLTALAIATLYGVRLNRQLKQSRVHLEEARSGLERDVQERTASLEMKRLALMGEVRQRKEAEQESLRSKEEWERTFDTIPDLIALIGTDWRIMRANRALAVKLAVPAEALVGRHCYENICGADEPPRDCPHATTMHDGGEHSTEMTLPRFGGEYLVTTAPLRGATGTMTGCVHISRDITKRKEAEDALRQSESRFRGLVEQSLVGIYVISDGKFLYVNPKLSEIFGYGTQSEIVFSRTVADLVAPANRALVAENIRKRLAGEVERIHYLFQGLKRDGTLFDAEAYGTRTEIDGRPAVIGTLLDVTERNRLEREREEALHLLQSIIDGVDEDIMVIAPDRRVVMMNSKAREIVVTNTFCYHILHHRDRPCDEEHPCPLEEVLRTGQSVTVNHVHKKKDGSDYHVEILASPILGRNGEVIYVVEACRDVTIKRQLEQAKKRLDEQFYLEQKDQSILTLAGGIAHDFNNSLMGMMGNAELVKLRLSPDAAEQEMVRNIIVSGRHMADLTRQLLEYARVGSSKPEILAIGHSIEYALSLVRKGAFSGREATLGIAGDLWPVFADDGQIIQVLSNLFTNAFEAMEGRDGAIAVHASNVQRDPWKCSTLHHEHPAGSYVHISISDTGPGIPAALQLKIFEPFFSTKFLGRGLGLAAAVGIIQHHHGCISAESEEGKGAVFHIYLPAVPQMTREFASSDSKQEQAQTTQNRVLIVDDDPQIRSLVESMLLQMGKYARAARSGAEAIEIFKQEKGSFGLAILDIQLPDMDGKKLFEKLKALNPGLKVLISSGYDEKTVLQGFGAGGPEGFIQKPYWIDTLEEKVNKILRG